MSEDPSPKSRMSERCRKVIVLDTSVFSDPQARKWLGRDIPSAVRNFLKLASYAHDLAFYMPRAIRDELVNMSGSDIPMLDNHVSVKSPKIFELTIPAALFYEFLNDLRTRVDRGLRVSEDVIRKEKELSLEERIRSLRERYRTAMRSGIVDSKEDFEVILLAKELEGTVVTADKGLLKYADKTGISVLDAHLFPEFLIYEAQKYNEEIVGLIKGEELL